jgi:hypothetical protein
VVGICKRQNKSQRNSQQKHGSSLSFFKKIKSRQKGRAQKIHKQRPQYLCARSNTYSCRKQQEPVVRLSWDHSTYYCTNRAPQPMEPIWRWRRLILCGPRWRKKNARPAPVDEKAARAVEAASAKTAAAAERAGERKN